MVSANTTSLDLRTLTYILIIAVMDQDGMYHDVTVLDIGDEAKKKPDPTADVKHFFGEPFSLDMHGKKKRRFCKICKYVSQVFHLFLFCLIEVRKRHPGDASGLGDDCTSLRRHMQAYHRVMFNLFLSWQF